MLTKTADKKKYFNRYWQTRDIPSADARSVQRAEMTLSLLEDYRTKELLDIGCGRGLVMTYLSGKGYSVAGCDLSTDTVSALQSDGYDVFIFDIENHCLPKKYDGILCLEVLQQVFDPVEALEKFAESLNNDGVMIVSVPNEYHLWSRICMLFGDSHLGHFDESHIRLFTPERARQLFDRAMLTIDDCIPVSIIPPKNKLLDRIGAFLARTMPSLFSLSQIYRLKLR